MHAFRKYLQDGLDARSWQQADLMRASGLTRQRVSQMLSDDRDALPSVPRRETLQAIARAFNVRESTVTAVAFEAMGYDLAAVRREADLSTATDGQLVRALADRLGVGLDSKDGEGSEEQPAPKTVPPAATPAGGDLDPEQLGLAARRTGAKSRTQQARDQQDQDGEE